MALFEASAGGYVLSVSATTTSQPVAVQAHGGRPRNVVATVIAHGTFGGTVEIPFEVSPELTSANGAYHWVPLNLDPAGNLTFISSGKFTSAGAVNLELGSGSVIRGTVKTTAAGPISLFYQL